MGFDQTERDRKSESGSLFLGAEKGFEDVFTQFLRNARTFVLNTDKDVAPGRVEVGPGKFPVGTMPGQHPHPSISRAGLRGIAHEIQKYLMQFVAVRFDVGKRCIIIGSETQTGM